jgi:biotin carboxylase
MTRRVLVTDGGERAALATVRALGRSGFAVDVCATRTPSLAGASRYRDRELVAPDPLADPAGFRAAIAAYVGAARPDVVLPISEQALRAVLPAELDARGVRVPFPPAAVFAAVSDKQRVLEAARTVGLAVPEQWVATDAAAAARLAASALPFPVVVKPTRSVAEGDGGAVRLGVSHAADASELAARLAALPPAAYPVLVQRRLTGPGVGVFLLVWDGAVLAAFAHRRLREKPPAGGVSVYRESVPLDPDLAARARALLACFGWRGVAMVEFKLDAASGTPYVMEVNGRLWGSLQLAIDAGVDFPTLLVRAALGERPAPVTTYRFGVRSRWWWGDVDHLIARLRRSAAALALPPGAPSRWRALRDFLVLWRPGDRSEILRLTDPWPFVRETLDWVRGL